DLLTREQPHEVRLAGAVRTDHPDPLAEPDLGVERPDDPRDPEPAHPEPPLAGAPPLDPHPDVLHVGLVGRLLTLLEPVEPVLRRTRLRGPVVVVRGLAPHLLDHVREPAVLRLVPAVVLVQPVDAGVARLGVAREPAVMGPGRAPLER